jgi:hypothetical protein
MGPFKIAAIFAAILSGVMFVNPANGAPDRLPNAADRPARALSAESGRAYRRTRPSNGDLLIKSVGPNWRVEIVAAGIPGQRRIAPALA